MPSTTKTIDQLCLSPFNARINRRDAEATETLEASILADGLLHAINVHPMLGNKGKWGAFAGGRRYRAISKLIARGDLPKDWPVKVQIYEDLSEVELLVRSMAENMLRRDLRDYELYACIRRTIGMGGSLETIAAELGQEPIKVRRWLKVGQIAPPVFDAFAEGHLSLEQAQAYAARDDHRLQLAVFEQLQAVPEYEKTPEKIRARLKVGDRQLGQQLRFVGDDAYRAAGGRFELDLFADGEDERGTVVDEGVLAELVNAKLDGLRADLRERSGRDLRFVPKPPAQPGYDFPDPLLRVMPEDGADRALVLPEGDIVAHIVIGESGEPAVSWWWASRSAKFGSEKGDKPRDTRPVSAGIAGPSSPAALAANRAIQKDDGLTSETVDLMRSIRRAVMRAALLDDAGAGGEVGLDFLVWSQLRLLLDKKVFANQIGVATLSGVAPPSADARKLLDGQPATKIWIEALMELHALPAMTDPDLRAAFTSYTSELPTVKRWAAAMVAGFALDRSLNAGSYNTPVHDAIAELAGLADEAAVRHYWEPGTEFIDRIPLKQRLAIAEPFMERAAFATWSRLKSSELTRAVMSVLDGTAQGLRAAMKDHAASWVHPLLRFGPIGADEAPADASELEVAE